ncbi:MAG: radical SAM protein [Myxococcota bacterium]
MGRTASGEPRADRWRASLLLTVTRRCNLRCAYCPTVKDGLPDLTAADAMRALDVFVATLGGGEVKLFGGEPLLVPEVVEAVIREAPPTTRVYLSTNALHLDARWIALLHAHPSVTLTVSLDGHARDHDALRRGAPSHDPVVALLPELLRLPRFVVTQTIAPATAARAAANFRHLRALGITRFNLLPGYFLPWRPHQLAALETSFGEIADVFEEAWRRGERLYLRNLFVRAPTPFFNTGMVVDVDRTIHPSNLILAGAFDGLRGRTAVGTLDDPPTREALEAAGARVPALLREHVPADVLASTEAADAALTRLCNRLYPAYFARLARERAA